MLFRHRLGRSSGAQQDHQDIATAEPSAPSGNKTLKPALSGQSKRLQMRARSGSSILDEPFDQEVGAAKGDQEEQLFPARPRIFKSIEEASDEADQDSRSAVDSGSAARSGKLKQIEWASDVRFGSDDEDARMQQKAGTAIIGTSAASRGQGNKRKIFTAARSGSSLLDVPYDLEIGVAPEFILMQQQDTGAAGSGSATVPSTQQNAKRRMFGTGATRSGSSLALDEPYDVEIGGPVLGPPNQPQQAAAKRRAMMRARSGSSVLDEPYDVEIGAAGVGAAAALTKAALAKKATFDSIQEEDQEDRPGSAPGAAGGGMVSSGQQATTGAGAPGGTKSRRSAFLTNKATRSGSSLQLDEPFDVEIDEGQPALDKDADAGEQPTLGGGARRRALFDKRRSGSSVLDEPYDEEVAAELQTGADQQKPSSFAKRGRMLSGGRSGTLSNLAEIDEGDEEQRSTESSGQQSGKKRFGPSRSIEWAPDVVFDKDNADEQNGDNTEPGEQQQLSGPPGGKRRSFAGATRSSSSLMLDDPYDVEIDQGQLDAADELTTTTAPRQARPKQGMKSLRTRSGSSLMLDEPYDIEVLGGDQPHSTSKPSVGETKRSSFGRRAQTGSSTALQKIEEGKDEDQEFLDAFADETEEVIGAAGVSGTKRGAFRVSKSIEWAADVQFGQQEEDRAGQEELDGTTVLNPAAARKRRFMAARSGSSLLDEPFDVEVLEHQGPLSAAAAGGMKQEQQMKRKKFMSARSGSSLLDPAFDEEVPLEIGELDTLAPVMDPKKASGTQQQQMRSKAFRQGRSGSSLALDEPFEVLDETKELQGVDFFPLYPVREDTAEQQTTPGQHQDRRLAPILKKKQSGSTQDQESASDSMSQSSKIQGGTTSAEQQSKLFGAQNNKSSSSTTGGGPHAKISADQIGTADDQDQPLLEFQETRCAANEVVGQALKRTSAVDAVIALTHQSTAEDKELMRTEPDIDILLGGFEREPLEWYVDENGKSLGQEWDPVIQKFIAIQGPDRLAVKPGPDAVSVLDLWLVPDNDEVLQQDAPRPPIGDTEEDEITEFDDEQLTEVMTPDQKLLQKMNRFPTVEQRSPRWNQQRTMPSRTGRRLVIGRHRHVKLVPTRAHMKDYDEKGFEPDEEFSTMLHKYQKFLNLENMNLLQWTDYDDRLAKVASCEEDSFDRMREMALAEYISLVQRMDRGRKLGRNTTEDEIKALRAVENVIAAGRPTVHEESVCSGTDNSRRPNWTTKDAEWRQCTFHSLVADLVLPELVGADARDRTLLLLPATHYLSFVSGGKDYGLDDPRFTRYELLKEFIPPIIDDFPEGTPASERNRPKDLSNQKRAELRLVRLKISGLDLLKLLYESEAFLRGTNSYLQYDHSAICINDFTDLNLPKISDKDMKRNKFPGFPGKKKKMKSAGGNASSYAPSTAGDVETHTGESTLAWREEQDRIEEEARLAALEKVEEEQIEEAFLSVMENARADRMEACGGVLGFPVSGDSSEISGYDPDERLEGWASSSEKAAAENKKDDDDNSENGDKSPGGSDSGGDMSGLDPDDDENKLSKSKEKDKIDLLDAESLLPSTESDHYDPNEMIKTKVPADFQILSVFGEQFDRSQFYQIVVPGTLLLHETAKPGDHRLVQPLIVGGQRKVRPRKRQKAQLEEEESSEDEDEKRRRYNAAPPVRDQVYNLLKDQVAPRQLGKESVKPIVENSPLLVELVLKHLLQDLWEDLSPFWSKSKKFTLGGLKPLPKDGDIDESKLPPIVRVRRRLHLIQQMQRGEKLYDMEDPIEVRKDKQMLEKLVNLLDSERDVAPEELVEILEKYQKDNVLANLDPRLLKRALNERLPAPMSKWATLRLQDEPSGTEESSSATGGERSGSGQEDGEKEKRPASGDQGSVAKSVGTGEKESSAGGDKDQKSESKSDSQSLKDSHSQKDSDSRSLSQSQSQRGSQSSKQVSSSATPGGTKGDTTTSAARQVEASAGRSRRSGASSKFSRDDELERIEEENVLARSRQSSKDAAETVVSSATGTTGAAGAMKEGTKPAKESTTPKDSHSASGRSTGTSRKTGRTRGSHKSGKEIDPNAYRGIEWNGVRIAKSLSPEREQKRRDLFFSDDTLVSELEKGMEQMARRMKFYKKQTPKELLYEMQKRADTGKLGRHLVFNMPLLSGSETELEKAREKIDPVMSTSELEM
ncbi:unnamed protein product [Amoebophrya sp. A120]|nr:unnamed protein product [Amoebophrya sp. A120]|eukprot:GSA120T00017235001.1